MAPVIKLSVVVCTYNREKLLPVCLDSLIHQSLSPDDYEIIIINNNSTDQTHVIAEHYAAANQQVKVFLENQQGLSHARNRGYKEAAGQYVAYIDDDGKADFNWCKRILTAFEQVNPAPAAVGGQILPWYESTPPLWFTDDFEIRTWGNQAIFLQLPLLRYGFSGSNMIFPKQILEEFKGFSPDFGMVNDKLRLGEETDLFNRISQKYPYFWYDPELKVFHYVPADSMKVKKRCKRSLNSGIAIALINKKDQKPSAYLPGLLKLLAGFILPFFRIVKNIFKHKYRFSTIWIKFIAELCYRWGYLLGYLFK